MRTVRGSQRFAELVQKIAVVMNDFALGVADQLPPLFKRPHDVVIGAHALGAARLVAITGHVRLRKLPDGLLHDEIGFVMPAEDVRHGVLVLGEHGVDPLERRRLKIEIHDEVRDVDGRFVAVFIGMHEEPAAEAHGAGASEGASVHGALAGVPGAVYGQGERIVFAEHGEQIVEELGVALLDRPHDRLAKILGPLHVGLRGAGHLARFAVHGPLVVVGFTQRVVQGRGRLDALGVVVVVQHVGDFTLVIVERDDLRVPAVLLGRHGPRDDRPRLDLLKLDIVHLHRRGERGDRHAGFAVVVPAVHHHHGDGCFLHDLRIPLPCIFLIRRPLRQALRQVFAQHGVDGRHGVVNHRIPPLHGAVRRLPAFLLALHVFFGRVDEHGRQPLLIERVHHRVERRGDLHPERGFDVAKLRVLLVGQLLQVLGVLQPPQHAVHPAGRLVVPAGEEPAGERVAVLGGQHRHQIAQRLAIDPGERVHLLVHVLAHGVHGAEHGVDHRIRVFRILHRLLGKAPSHPASAPSRRPG